MAEPPLSAEEISHRGFPSTFRGFDPAEVRAYLVRVAGELKAAAARERDLAQRLKEAEHRAANPVIDQATLTRSLGEETSRVLVSAQEAAQELKVRAEESVAGILREAHDQAQRIRAEAEVVLADRTDEAGAAALDIRREAQAEASAIVEQARQDAEAARADVAVQARQLVQEAQAARVRVLGDLTRRRRIAHTQVEQLRAGRDRLLEAYRVVRRTLDEVSDELQRAEPEAREAAGVAGRQAEAALDVADSAAGEGAELADEATAAGEIAVVEQSGAANAPTGDAFRTTEPEEAPPSPVEIAAPIASVAAAQAGAAPRRAPSPPGPVVARREEQAAERKLSSLRILRRPRPDTVPAAELEVVESPSEVEGVRIIATAPEPSAAAAPSGPATPSAPLVSPGVSWAPTPGPAPTPAAAAEGEVSNDLSTPSPVDDLFARLRADRAGAAEQAHEVLEGANGSGAAGHGDPDSEPGPDPASATAVPEPDKVGEIDERLLQQRDEAVESLEANLTRKLKRSLQDDQNDVLDRLRSCRGTPDASAFLPVLADHAGRYAEATRDLLLEAARAGARFVSPDADVVMEPEVADVVVDLTEALVGPLRRGIERGTEGGEGDDAAALVEAVGAAYRECRAQRLERLAAEATIAAFSRGTVKAAHGATLRWVVDDGDRACSDCDDNALAGPTSAGQPYPTGQAHPPAHDGCRCLLVPSGP